MAIALLRGLGQIMLQENVATGILFLVGIFYGSVFMGLASVVSVVCGTLTAKILRYDKGGIEKGLYGFSAALVGVALTAFFQPTPIIWIMVVFGATLATIIQHFFIQKNIPVFTLPFILVTWTCLFLIHRYFPEIALAASTDSPAAPADSGFAIRGFGAVIFQDSLISGILFFVAVYISAPRPALYGLTAALVAAMISSQFSASVADVQFGLFSYNAVLCAIALTSEEGKGAVWTLAATILAVLIQFVMMHYSIAVLTFPFVLAVWIVLVIKSVMPEKSLPEKTK